MPLEVGEGVATITEVANEVMQHRVLEVKARVQKAIEVGSRGDEVV